MDIIKAYEQVKSCVDDLKQTREQIEAEFYIIYQQAERLATKISIQPSLPRVAIRQQHRSNTPATTPKEYYRRTIAVPLVDHLISEMDFRFNKFSQRASTLVFLVPSIACELDKIDITDAVEQYQKRSFQC